MISFISNYKENYNPEIRSCIDDIIDNVIDDIQEYYKKNNIFNVMLIDKRLDKYSNYLKNTIYIDESNILNIPLGSYIIYITKENLMKKGGFLVKIINEDIYKIKNYNKTWIIYNNKYYMFYKEPVRDKLRSVLDSIINNDFKIKIKNKNH
tara:strand:- start:57 stop:509 length:453 start_codon:yes stop_codon:yes gene_type:complete